MRNMSKPATKTRVLHVTFDMTIGGAQQVIRHLVENIDQAVIQSEIVCIDNKLGEFGEALTAQGIKIHLLERKQGIDRRMIGELRSIIRSGHYDIIHCHQYTPYFYGFLAAVLLPAKVIFTEHGRFYPDRGSWKRKLINRVIEKFTKSITAISRATKQALIEYENFSPERIEVIYNGVIDKSDIEVDEDQLRSEFDIPSNKMILGTISRLQPIKNQEMMIKSFKQLHQANENTHLLIVGDGTSKSRLEKLAEDLGLTSAVSFTGFQPNPYQFHRLIDVFLLSSFSEGTSMTLLESMSHAKPSVVTGVGGNPELVEDGESGFVVPSDDMTAFTEACQKLVLDSELRAKLGGNARKLFLERFTIDTMVSNFLGLYGRCIR